VNLKDRIWEFLKKNALQTTQNLEPLKFSDDKDSAGFDSALVIFRRPGRTSFGTVLHPRKSVKLQMSSVL
jgi:hypothetical protein